MNMNMLAVFTVLPANSPGPGTQYAFVNVYRMRVMQRFDAIISSQEDPQTQALDVCLLAEEMHNIILETSK